MTFDAERVKVGRAPVLICEIDLDQCANTYGTAPCTATGSAGFECYQTRSTCQDPANYTLGTALTLKFSNAFIPGEDYINCINAANLAPTVINPEKGLGLRASITVTLNDFPHHDRGIDPYVANRTYTPEDQGTYFAKMLARNRHFIGRALRIKSGYIDAAGFNIADFQVRNYVIDTIEGPDNRGRVKIKAKDILKLADDKRALAPAPSTGVLVAGITSASTSLTVTSGTESEYNAESDYIRVGEEIILAPAANRASNVFSNLSRGQFNTAAAAHDLGDSVQAVKYMNATNVVDLVEDLLTNYANITASYINSTDWASEETTWFSTSTISTVISEPEGVTKLINELAEQFYFNIWWDEIDQEIKLKAIVPPDQSVTIPELTDDGHLLDGSTTVNRDENKRLSRIVFYYDPLNPIETDKPSYYKSVYIQILSDEESAELYGDVRNKVIFGRFVNSQALAVQAAGRTLSRWGNSPREIKTRIDAKDIDVWTGDLVDINSYRIQGNDGANGVTRGQVLSVEEITTEISGSHYQLKVLETNFSSRYGAVGPNTLTTYDLESDANKAAYGFIAPDSAIFDDGESAYLII